MKLKHNVMAFVFATILPLTSQSHSIPEKAFVATIQLKNYSKEMLKLKKMDLDIAGVDLKAKKVDLILTVEQRDMLRKKGYILEIDESKSLMRTPDEEYKNPKEIESILKEWNNKFPEITKLEIIGKSSEGRNIYALKISDNASVKESDEPAILFNSMHHAREVMSPEISLDIIEQLLTGYGTNKNYTRYVNNNEIYIVPMLNVDGNAKVWRGKNMWRKNTKDKFGVDINRNYPNGWGSCGGSSGSRFSDQYRGKSPGSEEETQALMGLVKRIRPVFDISYHSYSELVIYPKGCRGEYATNREIVEGIGHELGKLLDYAPGTGWELLYPVDGSDIDWMSEEYQVIPYVLEVNSRKEGFQPNYSKWRDKTVKRNRPAWQHLLNRLDQSSIRGKISGQGLKTITIAKVSGLQVNKLQVYKANEEGRFHFVLKPGQYQIQYKVNNELITKNFDVKDKRININL
jgi:hypothetical protein